MTIDIQTQTAELFDEGTKFDDQFGGQLLHETALEVAKELAEAKNDVRQAWLALVGEVLDEHRWEREILSHHLTISEFRPRTFFSLMPDASDWQPVDVHDDNLLAGAGVNCLHIAPRIKRTPPTQEHAPERLSILLPISNGYRRSFRALACLAYDISRSQELDRFEVDLHVCVNYTDDNTHYEVTRFANTMGRARGFGLYFYSLDDRKVLGLSARPGMVRTSVLNMMLAHLSRRSGELSDDHFVHFCDDDIFIHPNSRLVAGNIGDLRRDASLQLISGAYTCDDDTGFSAISAIRKRTEFVQCQSVENHTDRLANLYGGCLTTTLKRLSQVVNETASTEFSEAQRVWIPTHNCHDEQIGFDPILTVLSNNDVVTDVVTGVVDDFLPLLRAYATRTRCVGQPEATSIVGMVKRYWRDRDWGRRTVDHDTWSKYAELRRRSFTSIEENIMSRGSPRDRAAHRWHSQIRKSVKGWDESPSAVPRWLRENSSEPVDRPAHIRWDTHKTRHQICKDIVQDPDVLSGFQALATTLPDTNGVKEVLERYIAARDRESEFPVFAKTLAALKYEDILPVLTQNKYLFHLHRITEESIAVRSQFAMLSDNENSSTEGMTAERLPQLEARCPVCLAKILASAFPEIFAEFSDARLLEPAPEKWVDWNLSCTSISSLRGYAFFVSKNENGSIPIKVNSQSENPVVAEEPLFIRYFDVLGPTRFHRDSPRRVVYLHVLGECVIEHVFNLTEKIRADVDFKSQSKSGAKLKRMKEADGVAQPTIVMLVDTYYPSLEEAVVHYAGPERRTPFHRMMHSLMIQESLKGSAFPLKNAVLGDRQWKDVARCLARFLGALHGVTLGFRSYLSERILRGQFNYEVSLERCWPLLRLLIEHLDQIRLLKTEAYSDWLTTGGDRPRTLGEMRGFSEIVPATIASKVANLIRQDGHQLAGLWADVCRKSCEFHADFGAVGHQGLYAANLYLAGDGEEHGHGRAYTGDCRIEMVRLADFAGIAMIDPAVEAGTVLAELMSVRIREQAEGATVDDHSLPVIRDSFRDEYVSAFEFYRTHNPLVQGNDSQHRKFSLRDLTTRIFQFAGFALLSTHQSDEESLPSESQRRIIQNCVDLLHAGTSIGLRFRDSSPFFDKSDI